MVKKIIEWILSAIALLIVSNITPGFHVSSFTTALVAVAVMAIVNMLVKPILFILTLPLTIITLGLFTFILNAIMFLIVSSLTPGFIIDGLFPAIIGSILFTFTRIIFKGILK